jgi:hypothetical protein
VEKESPRKEKERVKDEEDLPLEIVRETKRDQEKAAKPLANIFHPETAIASSEIIVVSVMRVNKEAKGKGHLL